MAHRAFKFWFIFKQSLLEYNDVQFICLYSIKTAASVISVKNRLLWLLYYIWVAYNVKMPEKMVTTKRVKLCKIRPSSDSCLYTIISLYFNLHTCNDLCAIKTSPALVGFHAIKQPIIQLRVNWVAQMPSYRRRRTKAANGLIPSNPPIIFASIQIWYTQIQASGITLDQIEQVSRIRAMRSGRYTPIRTGLRNIGDREPQLCGGFRKKTILVF